MYGLQRPTFWSPSTRARCRRLMANGKPCLWPLDLWMIVNWPVEFCQRCEHADWL